MTKPQSEFPLIEEYRKVFPIDKRTIFAYDDSIYTNYQLPEHIQLHEEVHLKQQKRIGLKEWVKGFLYDVKFRLEMELEAFKVEVDSIKDGNQRLKLRMQCALKLSSPLYGSIISYSEALSRLS